MGLERLKSDRSNFRLDKLAKDGTRRGRPKGSKGKKTIEKEQAREILRQAVIANLGPMLEAQIQNAKGIKYRS